MGRPKWNELQYRGITAEPWLKQELDLDWYVNWKGLLYPEHDDDYIRECLLNLGAKGAVLYNG
ncbi:hypothetical protein PV403_05405 [Paenibacillus sp. GYB006]|uniref:hypothetical protein n=1 Tax=Paenibacillus sp. GYB006 TaxID=2994394 RepID=UPI002F96250C